MSSREAVNGQPVSSLVAVFNSALNTLLNQHRLDPGALVLISGIVVYNAENRLSIDDGTGVTTAHTPGSLSQGLSLGDYVDAFACVAHTTAITLRPSLEIVGVQLLKDPNIECLRALEVITRAALTSGNVHAFSAAGYGRGSASGSSSTTGPYISSAANTRTPHARAGAPFAGAAPPALISAGASANATAFPKLAIHSTASSGEVLRAVESAVGGGDLVFLAAAVGAPALVVAGLLEELQMGGMVYSAGDKYFPL